MEKLEMDPQSKWAVFVSSRREGAPAGAAGGAGALSPVLGGQRSQQALLHLQTAAVAVSRIVHDQVRAPWAASSQEDLAVDHDLHRETFAAGGHLDVQLVLVRRDDRHDDMAAVGAGVPV